MNNAKRLLALQTLVGLPASQDTPSCPFTDPLLLQSLQLLPSSPSGEEWESFCATLSESFEFDEPYPTRKSMAPHVQSIGCETEAIAGGPRPLLLSASAPASQPVAFHAGQEFNIIQIFG